MVAARSAARRRALHVWAALVYWTGKAAGVLVAESAAGHDGDAGRHAFADAAGGWRRWAETRAWNAACLAALAHRVHAETWPATVGALRLPRASCYDIVCRSVWCVCACVYYATAWLDRASEACVLLVAVTWRRRSTVRCLNSAAAVCFDYDGDGDQDDGDGDQDDGDADQDDDDGPTPADVPWHAYLTVAFPVVQFAVAANEMTTAPRDGHVWRTAVATVATVASCAPAAAHGTAAALLVVANTSMRSINHRITRVSPAGRPRRLRTVVARLARRHWRVAELVTGGVCGAYGMDFMTALLMAVARVTYVAVSVFHRLTNESEPKRADLSLGVAMQLIGWFGQFAYMAYTCEELAAQSSEMFDNLNSLLLDIFEESRLSGETYLSKIQEIEAVQEFMRQVVVRKVFVKSCNGLITLNLSLITTIIGVTLTYFIVLLQFESSTGGSRNNTRNQ